MIKLYLGHPGGTMHHDPSKRVLAVHRLPEEIAKAMGKSTDTVQGLINSAKAALLRKRKMRKPPLIDQTLYTSLNGMLIAAYFRAYLVLGEQALLDRAVRSLGRVLRDRAGQRGLLHCPGVNGLLDDYVHLIDALISGYEATGDHLYIDRAEGIMAQCFEKFLDREEGGFFDTEETVLGISLKRIEDVPHASANALVILLLLKLSVLTGREPYRDEAERSLRIFAPEAGGMGIHAGTYYCALHAYFNSFTITIEAAPQSVLARQARMTAVRSYSTIRYGEDKGRVISCLKGVCSVLSPA